MCTVCVCVFSFILVTLQLFMEKKMKYSIDSKDNGIETILTTWGHFHIDYE